jgi:hypothetical protein
MADSTKSTRPPGDETGEREEACATADVTQPTAGQPAPPHGSVPGLSLTHEQALHFTRGWKLVLFNGTRFMREWDGGPLIPLDETKEEQALFPIFVNGVPLTTWMWANLDVEGLV